MLLYNKALSPIKDTMQVPISIFSLNTDKFFCKHIFEFCHCFGNQGNCRIRSFLNFQLFRMQR